MDILLLALSWIMNNESEIFESEDYINSGALKGDLLDLGKSDQQDPALRTVARAAILFLHGH